MANTTRDELIAYLQTLPAHTEIEVLVVCSRGWDGNYHSFVPLKLGENTEVLDMRGNQFAKGKPYENSVTLQLGED